MHFSLLITLSIALFVSLASSASAQTKRKVIIDQDARGPATTDQQSILVFLQSPEVETLGITVVSGDMWRDEEVAHTCACSNRRPHRYSGRSGRRVPADQS